MHLHGPQFNANLQLSAAFAAVRAEARREAEQTRRKLVSVSSALLGEADEDCIVTLRGREDGEEQAAQGGNQDDASAGSDEESDDTNGGPLTTGGPFSNYA